VNGFLAWKAENASASFGSGRASVALYRRHQFLCAGAPALSDLGLILGAAPDAQVRQLRHIPDSLRAALLELDDEPPTLEQVRTCNKSKAARHMLRSRR
jgi:hypothetical protein